MAHEDILEQKRAELEAELAAWAREQSLLEQGERLVVLLLVESIELVGESGSVNYHAMPVREFFSEERCIAANVPKRIISRMSILWRLPDVSPEDSMRVFLEEYPRTSDLRRQGFGTKTSHHILRMVRAAGLAMEDDAHVLEE